MVVAVQGWRCVNGEDDSEAIAIKASSIPPSAMVVAL